MKEYIEKADAINLLWLFADESCASVVSDFEGLPAADVAEVRHRRWIRQPSEISGLDVEFCSECGQGMNERNQFWNAKYCPNCGARMDKEDEHEAG